ERGHRRDRPLAARRRVPGHGGRDAAAGAPGVESHRHRPSRRRRVGGGAVTAEKETAEVVSAEATGQAAGVAASATVVTARDVLPVDQTAGTFVGRVWDPARGVPVPVALRGAQVWDASELAGTSA